MISRDGSDSKEINRRLSMGRVAIAKLDKILKDSDIRKGTKIKLVETIVFPVVTYGSESWTVRKRDRKRIDAFELWTWRIMLRIPWTAKRTNLSVVEEVKPKRTLEATILRQKLRYFSHAMRAKLPLGRDIMLGQVAGCRRQGKPRMRWVDSIKEATGLRMEVLKEVAQDRKKWREMVQEKTKNRERTNVHQTQEEAMANH
jgi:hypothetical protein